MDRVILHCDLNNFYASVECQLRPELKLVPMAVGGDAQKRRGVVLAKNNLAKAKNVLTGEPLWQAYKKCPELVVVPPHHDLYLEYSHKVREIYQEYTDQVEPFGIDECWLDVTGSRRLFGSGEEIGHKIRNAVKERLGLTISVGVSFNKIFAKLGSDLKKPDALTVIDRNNYREIVWPLPLANLLYVGRSTGERLFALGLKTIGDLARADREILSARLGKWGVLLHDFAAGLDDSPVALDSHRELPKSIGHSTTLAEDITTWEEVERTFYWLAEKVGTRLRRKKLWANNLGITIRDNKFRTITRQKKLPFPMEASTPLAKAALELCKENYALEKQLPIRLLGLRVTDLTEIDNYWQASLFTENLTIERQGGLDHKIDEIRDKFGFQAIQRAAFIGLPEEGEEE